jgi:hypothetical protein
VLKQEQTLVFKVVKKKALSARRNKQTADKSNVSIIQASEQIQKIQEND